MATLAIAGAGALGTSALGLGGSIGWLAGTLLANLLFPPPQQQVTTEGPRLGDLSVSSSAFGAPITIAYGTVRVSGNMIWSSGIEETKHSTSSSSGGGGKGGGGGGVKQTSITYTYSANFAMAFGEGEADDVLRIWADGKLIFDRTGTGQVADSEFVYRFYPGSETQLCDATIEAWVEDQEDLGEGYCPAFRGLCYIVFEDFQLANFGNRIPNITAEITFNKSQACPQTDFTFKSGEPSGYSVYGLMVDPERGRCYLSDATGSEDETGFRAFDWWSGTEIQKVTAANALSGQSLLDGGLSWRFVGIDTEGYLYAIVGSTNSRPLLKIDGNSLHEVARFGSIGGSTTNGLSTIVATKAVAEIRIYGLEGIQRVLVVGSFFDDIAFLDQSDMSMISYDNEVDEGRIGGICSGKLGEAWVVGYTSSGTSIGLYKASAEIGAGMFGGIAIGTSLEKVATITNTDLGTAGNIEMDGPVYDEADDGVILFINCTDGNRYVVKVVDGSILWQSNIATTSNIYTPRPATTLRYGVYGFIAGANSYTLNTRDGTWESETCWSGASGIGSQFYSALDHSVTKVTGSSLKKFYLNRGTGNGVALSTIIDDLCDRANMDSGDYNTAQLTDTVRGYLVGRQMSVRAAIDPLAQTFLFDGVESDYVLKFVKRGGSSVEDIAEQKLVGQGENNDPWEESRMQEVELPEKINVNFLDYDADYQQGAQYAKRISNPVPTMYSGNQHTLELPIVLIGDEAIQLAEKTLYTAWRERSRYKAMVGWEFLALDPTDVFTATVGDVLYSCRATAINVGVDLSIELESLSDSAALYVSTVTADTNYGFEEQSIASDGPTRTFFLDIPLLRDYDQTGGVYSRCYFAMGAYTPEGNPWPGALLYDSTDLEYWDLIQQGPDEATWGTTANALAAPASLWHTDEDSELKVYMAHGGDELASITQLQLVNGVNVALVGDEIIGFRDVTENADGSYTLTGLLRGRRGTDVFVDDHATGENFVVLSTATVSSFKVDLANLNTSIYYKTVTLGTLLEDADVATHSQTGKDLKPYAPVQLAAVYDGDDIDITWVRRTRIGGELRDGTGTVPIGEDTEAYEVDIYDTAGTTVVRTLSVSSELATYTAAMQYADGWSGGNLKFTVYQKSDVIGRGFGRTETVDMGAEWPGSSTTTTSSTTSTSTSSTTTS